MTESSRTASRWSLSEDCFYWRSRIILKYAMTLAVLNQGTVVKHCNMRSGECYSWLRSNHCCQAFSPWWNTVGLFNTSSEPLWQREGGYTKDRSLQQHTYCPERRSFHRSYNKAKIHSLKFPESKQKDQTLPTVILQSQRGFLWVFFIKRPNATLKDYSY